MDPDAKEHPFPADLPVKIAFGDGSNGPEGQSGRRAEVPRRADQKSFSIEIELRTTSSTWRWRRPAADHQGLPGRRGRAQAAARQGVPVFRLPKSLAQAQADWSADGTLRKAFDNLGDKATVIRDRLRAGRS
jgi:hypothetical protein